jgi:ubiquitin C-terminal hydrolase
VHSGGSYGGHYTAYVRRSRDKEPDGQGREGKREEDDQQQESGWWYTSDTYTHAVDFSEVQRAEAYMLFYDRITTRVPAACTESKNPQT